MTPSPMFVMVCSGCGQKLPPPVAQKAFEGEPCD
jgi:hypothetical protein